MTVRLFFQISFAYSCARVKPIKPGMSEKKKKSMWLVFF